MGTGKEVKEGLGRPEMACTSLQQVTGCTPDKDVEAAGISFNLEVDTKETAALCASPSLLALVD